MMKKTILLIFSIVFIGYYLTAKASQYAFNKHIEVKTYSDLYYKLETAEVSINEIIIGASEFSLTMCADKVYQEAMGSSTEGCNGQFLSAKNKCAKYLIKTSKHYYKSKEKVSQLTERFINCVS